MCVCVYMSLSFFWKAIEKMGCLFSKKEDKTRGNAYLYSDTADSPSGSADDDAAAKERAASAPSNGGFGSASLSGAGNTSSTTTNAATKKYPWDERPKLDPKDFMFMKLNGGVHIKPPGSINGQQFIIDSCEGCDLYVLDHTAQVTIDDCKDCRILIGPTDASVFIRDCENCTCAFVCRQFRTRDIKNVDIALHCATRPVIETSKGLRFGCYDFNYAGLGEHLAACSMSVYANHYSHIHDFNPDPTNWSFLPENTSSVELLAMPEEVRSYKTDDAHAEGHTLIRTSGERPIESNIVYALFPPSTVNAIPSVLSGPATSTKIVRANCSKLDDYIVKDLVDSIFDGDTSGSGRLLADFRSGKTVYLEFIEDEHSDAIMEGVAAAGAYVISEEWAVEFRFAGIDG